MKPLYWWLSKLHKRPYKARFIANSSSCTTTELSKLLSSCLTAVKNHVIRYCEKVYERSGKNLFWSIKNSGEVLNKLKSRGFRATSLSTYDFYTLCTTLTHNLIKEKLINLIEWTFSKRIIVRYKHIRYSINIMRLTQSPLITLLPFLIAHPWVRRQTQWWPRHKAIYFSWLGPELFCLLLGPPGFNCWFSFAPCSVPVVLFDTPGISRCRSQHISVESSSLFHHSIYLWFICFPWWFIDELENLHANRTAVCFEPWQKPRARLGSRKTGLSPPVI